MQDFDMSKNQLSKDRNDKNDEKQKLLKKRKREDIFSDPTAMMGEKKRQKVEEKSETFKSLFIKESKGEGMYEGDFMTRCAKWGL